jgi:Fur family ferric uptake transcriptional regulator
MSVASDVRHILWEHGYRLTSPRWLVFSALRSAEGHLTAEEITERVNDADPTVNRSSVYRSLTLFEELDLVRRSHLGIDESARWELAHPDDEFHLVCRSCGSVGHHAGALVGRIRSHLAEYHDFAAEGIDLVITGKCSDCARAVGSEATRPARTADREDITSD